MAKIIVRRGTYEDADQVIPELLEPFPFDWAGARVLLKPNILRPSKPEEGITTHPAVVRALLNRLKELGAEVQVGDTGGVEGYGMNARCAKVAGIIDAVGAHFVNLNNDPVEIEVPIPGVPKVAVSRTVLEADLVISIPRFKTHSLTILTGALKNCYGYVIGGGKARIHAACPTPESLSRAVVDVFQIRPPDLFIVDAVTGMEGNGPSSTHFRRLDTLLAGDNAVAVDALMAVMMGLEPKRVPPTRIAAERGLGPLDLSEVEIDGEFKVIDDYKLPATISRSSPVSWFLRRVFKRLDPKPRVQKKICTGCGHCMKNCPVKTIEIVDKKAILHKEGCISCYCCMEICPEQALTLGGWLFNRIQGREGRIHRSHGDS